MSVKLKPYAGDEYPLAYIGDDQKSGLMYDDWCAIVQDLPHGSTWEHLTMIGNHAIIRTYPDDDCYLVPRSLLRDRATTKSPC